MDEIEKGEIYGLYKQAKEGDNTNVEPYMADTEAKEKWDAWEDKKGMTKE